MKGQKGRWNTKWTYSQIQYSVIKYVPYVFSPKYPLLSNSQCHVSIMRLHDQSKGLRAEHDLSLCCMWQIERECGVILCFMSAGFLWFHTWPPFSSVLLYLAPTLFTDYRVILKLNQLKASKSLTPLFKTTHASWLLLQLSNMTLASTVTCYWLDKKILHLSSIFPQSEFH